MATYRTNGPLIRKALERGTALGLIAAAQVLINAMKRELRGGYTSGDFVTGRSMNSVTRSEPEVVGATGHIRVGTSLMYNLFWELGHHNLYTQRFERERKWEPTLIAQRAAIAKAFNAQMLRVLRELPRIGP
jgi:hypothetical protein